ncbi:MAG TPA: DEAD/DEAH box helicase [Candidatus Saccharimonadales bacterium]|nr:DEAD/DEAH box helicase [Candidatus Saccharimonadales bacterium]
MPYSSQRRSSGGNRSMSAWHSGGARPSRSGGRNNKKINKQYIHPSRFVKAAQAVTIEEYTPMHTFADFNIHPLLKQNIIDKGYITPSPIQDQAIPQGLDGKDVVGIANTGTGKTAAFALPTLNRLLNEPFARALIIAPTRELAQQIEEELRSIAKGSGLHRAVLIGGSSMGEQLRDLRDIPSIVIGTPGRIKDHIERGSIDLGSFNIITLDEVDRMLDMGFIADIRYILDQLHQERQSFFFSATMDPKIRELINTFTSNPVVISVKTGETSDNVEQSVVRYNDSSEKIDKLHDILTSEAVGKTLVFDETQRSVEKLAKILQERGFKADSIHGGKTQGQRTRALKQFKENKLNVLVATDVAARGIDIADITHVINFSTPQTYDDYVHRIGRVGRAGRTGHAMTFIDE